MLGGDTHRYILPSFILQQPLLILRSDMYIVQLRFLAKVSSRMQCLGWNEALGNLKLEVAPIPPADEE